MHDKKTRQVCAAVEHTLAYVLSAEVSDDRLNQLIILAVEPVRKGSRLRVVLGARESVQKAVEALERAKSYLKDEVAHALQKKHAPDLEFVVIPFSGAP